MILNGVYDKYLGYSLEMFWWIELNAGEITTINTNFKRYNAIQKRFCKPFIKMCTLIDLGTAK